MRHPFGLSAKSGKECFPLDCLRLKYKHWFQHKKVKHVNFYELNMPIFSFLIQINLIVMEICKFDTFYAGYLRIQRFHITIDDHRYLYR